MMKKILTSLVLVVLLFSFATPAFADGGKVLYGEDFVLKSGEKYEGDVVLFDGKLVLEEDSHLEGDVVIFGKPAQIAGYLEGDLVVFGDDITLESTARVDGDVVTFGGKVHKAEGAIIEGEEVEIPFLGWIGGLPWASLATFEGWKGYPHLRYFDFLTSFTFGIFRFFVTLLALMAVGVLIGIFWPEQVEQVGETILKAPFASGGVGLAALILGIPVGLVLILAACLGLVVWLAIFVAVLFGFTALASLVGNRLLKALNVQEFSPIVAIIVGVVVLRLIDLVPCLGFLLSIIIYSLGLGAVILTRFGTQPYPQVIAPPAVSQE
ncbi:MAG: hypothetical protein DRI61_05575 [Chloroflexi bacterium]|nr:MAG: hypothetical protein DRI61_05575 [Chloroflexota bacterium]